MTDSFPPNTSRTINLIASVRASLDTVKTVLGDGAQSEESAGQIKQLEQLEHLLLDQETRLESVNKVLEEFNYSVAHELCAPLRRISGFTREIKQRWGGELDAEGMETLDLILASSQQMNDLIDALMQISRLSHVELHRVPLDLSEIAGELADELTGSQPERVAVFSIKPRLYAKADAALLKIALRKLLSNAWKFTSGKVPALIEFGAFELAEGPAFYVRDNGVGFDMSEYGRLFHPFQRLHDPDTFYGYGIGLTAVKRIIERHGGRVWAEGSRDQGATFYFTL